MRTVTTTTSRTVAPQLTQNGRNILSLYSGIGGPMLTVGLIQSINFAAYDSIRRSLYTEDLRYQGKVPGSSDEYLHNDSFTNVAIASTLAGGIISFITSPLMTIKTKQQVMLWSMRKAAQDTWKPQSTGDGKKARPGGILNFYRGFGAHFFCDALGRGVYFTSYEYLKRKFKEYNEQGSNDQEDISLVQRMTCAGLSGMICWAFIFPTDVIRSKIYARSALQLSSAASSTSPSSSITSWELARELWRKDPKLFFNGFSITVLRAGPVAAIVLPCYDICLNNILKAI